MKNSLVAGLLTLAAVPASAATIDLSARGLQLADQVAASDNMSIIDSAPLDLGFVVVPGFFQAIDSTSSPVIELNTGDGIQFNFSISPGFSGSSIEVAREGDRQLELFFELAGIAGEAFGRLVLADGDSLDNVLTGSLFSNASFAVWNVEAASTTTNPVPLPAGISLFLAGLGSLAALRKWKTH